MRKALEPRYIIPENLQIGDTINVVWPTVQGLTKSQVGIVGTRQHEGADTVLYTPEGGELLRYNRSIRPKRVTLLDRKESNNYLMLFDN